VASAIPTLEDAERAAAKSGEHLLSRRDAAHLAGVSWNGIRLWEEKGRLTPIHVMRGGVQEVRIPRSQVETIMKERRGKDMGDAARIDALEAEVGLLKEDRDRLKADLDAERRRYDALLARLLEITGQQ